jgi:predicted AlkP superfamily pyrophosphatase or phosphodiesterase
MTVAERFITLLLIMRRLLVLVLVLCAGCAGRSVVLQPAASDKPLVILISYDGWRWDYDRKVPTPNLQRLIAQGVKAEGLIPAYPSKTFPNHYTIVTGLYPGHHGMVANTIRDPATGRVFVRSNPTEVADPMWWGGDPIWNVAQRSGIFAGTMFWPGSEAPVGGMRPRYWREYDEKVSPLARIEQLLSWLDLPAAERPSFMTLYLNEVDEMGHFYGPDSPQVRDAIAATDTYLGRLMRGLEQRGLSAAANIVIVSDHGMVPTHRSRTIVVDDYVPLADVQIVDINPTLGVVPAAGKVESVYQALSTAHPNLTMYRRDETPLHWRFRGQPRVPEITGVADEGWVVLRRGEVQEYWKRSDTGGQHGYEPSLESMRGIFVAAGPAFKQGARVAAFENVHVHNMLARAMGIAPARNDGDPAVADRVMR